MGFTSLLLVLSNFICVSLDGHLFMFQTEFGDQKFVLSGYKGDMLPVHCSQKWRMVVHGHINRLVLFGKDMLNLYSSKGECIEEGGMGGGRGHSMLQRF